MVNLRGFALSKIIPSPSPFKERGIMGK